MGKFHSLPQSAVSLLLPLPVRDFQSCEPQEKQKRAFPLVVGSARPLPARRQLLLVLTSRTKGPPRPFDVQRRSGLITLPYNVIGLMTVSVEHVHMRVNVHVNPRVSRRRSCRGAAELRWWEFWLPRCFPSLWMKMGESRERRERREGRREGKGNSFGSNGPFFISSRSPY